MKGSPILLTPPCSNNNNFKKKMEKQKKKKQKKRERDKEKKKKRQSLKLVIKFNLFGLTETVAENCIHAMESNPLEFP